MAYDPNYSRGNGNGWRGPRNYDNGQNNRGPYAGNAQARNTGNVQGGYKPNSGKAKINDKRRGPKDPVWTGVGNIMTGNGQVTVFFSVWENEDGSLGLTFKDANAPQEQGYSRPQGRPYSQNRGNGYPNGQNEEYRPQRPSNQSTGAMSRARPIPPAQYQNGPYDDRSPPPITEYPEGAPSDYDIQYDDENGPAPY